MISGGSQRASEHDRPIMPPEHGALAEHVAIHALELLQYAQAALDRRADLEADAPGKRPPQRRARVQHPARPLDLGADEGTPGVVATLLSEMALGDAVALHLVLRQI